HGHSIPAFAYVEEIDATQLESLRRQINETRQEDKPELTYLPLIILALVKTLRRHPAFNAHYDAATMRIRQYMDIHVGIATHTVMGLKVPVLRNAETLDLWGCARELRRLAAAARDNTARPEELTGSTISVTSLGKLGGLAAMPIINSPEVAILGINRAEERPVVRDNAIVIRRMMNISSCFDHRVSDGQDAAEMIQCLKGLLENPATLFI
ncbi:MAG TPA: dihydrolipoamide acetyltransferase family protein, partial [Gammaproteobacteria bacterium]|nr:dihydrolipoamide acetyltransferase family protein [Gammaproteobacteria bacterium]